MRYLGLLATLLLCSCASAPKIIAGKSAIYGMLSADAHSAYKRKRRDSVYSVYDDEIVDNTQGNVVDYGQLNELYVGLILPEHKPQQHSLIVSASGISPHSLALSVSDNVRIFNRTGDSHYFFMSEIGGEGFQDVAEIKAGESRSFVIKQEGDFELLSDNDERLKAIIFAKKNMAVKKLSSGQQYLFENLSPDTYQLIFWHWRLGKVEKKITLKAQENRHVDETLTVDNVMKSHSL